MLYGQHPFQARDASFAQKVVRGDYPIPADIPVSPSCLGLLKGILVPDPKARMAMMDIKQHAWFLQGRLLHVCCQKVLLVTKTHFIVKVHSECAGENWFCVMHVACSTSPVELHARHNLPHTCLS